MKGTSPKIASFNASLSLRYSAVCNPYLYKENNAGPKVSWRVFGLIFLVIIFSLLINIPRFFETTIVKTTTNITFDDDETFEIEKVSFEVTPLRMDENYIRYR